MNRIGAIWNGAALLLTLLAFVQPFSLPAQVSGGTIVGSVRDSRGALLSGAQISIVNVSTGIASSARTNADGYTVCLILRPAGTISTQVPLALLRPLPKESI